MTLFIACLLIYHFHMVWWWYVIAVVIWLLSITVHWDALVAEFYD